MELLTYIAYLLVNILQIAHTECKMCKHVSLKENKQCFNVVQKRDIQTDIFTPYQLEVAMSDLPCLSYLFTSKLRLFILLEPYFISCNAFVLNPH